METCAEGAAQKAYNATRYRDGLLITLLISWPVRMKNLMRIEIGRDLIFDGHDYRLELTAAETKATRPCCVAALASTASHPAKPLFR